MDKDALEELYKKYPQLRDMKVDKSLPFEQQKVEWQKRIGWIQEAVDKEKERAALIQRYPFIEEVIKDASLTPHQKKMKMLPVYRDLRERREDIDKDRRKLDEKIALAQTMEPAIEQYGEWKKLAPKLEKNDCSRLHQLIHFLKWQFRVIPEDTKGESPYTFPWHEVTPFVVEHDWAAAFKNATDYNDGAFNLPYEKCAFEFRISGRPVTVLAGQDSKDHEPNYRFYVGFKDCWISWSAEEVKTEGHAIEPFAISQIKAICVALDAEVATRNIVRASEGVNKKRVAEGREPFYSYHVVSLNRRTRVANPSSGGGVSHGKRRLHFRRGHWRHFAKFKTWVRWCLVGDPELGFIDKEYRL